MKQKKPCLFVRKRTTLTDRPPRPAKSMPTFARRGCCAVSVTDPCGYQSRFLRPQPQLLLPSSSIILMRLTGHLSGNLVAQGIKSGTSVSAARNSGHWTTETVHYLILHSCYLLDIRLPFVLIISTVGLTVQQ
jgi:hypothetical protein